ncbi:MAG: alpha/beta fold hydrolase, partial [Actinomycetota bacterium]
AAVIEGLLREQMAHRWPAVAACPVPALVIGHRLDPLHAYRDAVRLAKELPKGRMVMAHSILELRLRPGRILAHAIDFMDSAFDQAAGRKPG